MTAIAAAFHEDFAYLACDSQCYHNPDCNLDLKVTESDCGRYVIATLGVTGVFNIRTGKWERLKVIARSRISKEGIECIESMLKDFNSIPSDDLFLTDCKNKVMILVLDKIERMIRVSSLENCVYEQKTYSIGVFLKGDIDTARIDVFKSARHVELWCLENVRMACAVRPEYFTEPVSLCRFSLPIIDKVESYRISDSNPECGSNGDKE